MRMVERWLRSDRLKGVMSTILLVLVCCCGPRPAQAGPLADRIAAFPHWESKPNLQRATGDLVYPPWMAGNWRVTSTLVDLAAPLAPEIVTPGFESNRPFLNQSIAFAVRFIPAAPLRDQPLSMGLKSLQRVDQSPSTIGDRAFNGLNIARAYLGDRAVLAVKMDAQQPNRQIMLLRDGSQLVSTITERGTEVPAADRVITTELSQQVFRGGTQPYLNQVETTTAYHYLGSALELAVMHTDSAEQTTLDGQPSPSQDSNSSPAIEADQITAIYLSPQDAKYFQAQGKPVALYRYRLEFFPLDDSTRDPT
jgi:hypothetical protein